MKFLAVSLAYLCISFMEITEISAKVFTPCELAKSLQSSGIPQDKIADWVCTAKWESSFNTSAHNKKTRDFGLFQFHDGLWCRDGPTPGFGCNARCSDFLNDDITDDIVCAKKIYAETARFKKNHGDGFMAWYGYRNHCKGKNNNDLISGCF